MLVLLIACAAGPKAIDSEAVVVEDSGLSSWDVCEPVVADGRLDLVGGCADALCVGLTPDEVVAALGEPDQVLALPHSSGTQELIYAWASGLETGFADNNHDDVPDDGAVVSVVVTKLPWDGGSDAGLGLGATWACFLDAFGTPDYPLVDDPETAHYTWATWSDEAVEASDDVANAPEGAGDPDDDDGRVDELRIRGSS